MKNKELSKRYTKALYNLGKEKGIQDVLFKELREFCKGVQSVTNSKEYLASPLLRSRDKEAQMKKLLEAAPASEEIKNFVLLLAKKNRLFLIDEILQVYEELIDEENGVTRGIVESTEVLSPKQREEIEKFISKAVNKKVILVYRENPEIIGGLVARVGSYTFDDSLASHLKRLKEQLKRSVH
ncbi:MAG: ATP synthase F1 subunit delta [Bdellovibrio sp.]|nr:MAG: ATP synthase F1 subunit delta [Bdellovibrio sp.]